LCVCCACYWAASSSQPISAETLVNVIVCLQHLRKGTEIVAKIEADLQTNYPNHPYFNRKREKDDQFSKYAAN
jgi:hypothetical protein